MSTQATAAASELVADGEGEIDLRRLAQARMLRRTIVFLSTAFGTAIAARFSTELAGFARSAAVSEAGIELPQGMMFEYSFSLFALAFLLHLGYATALMAWRWRSFIPMLESRRAEEVAIALITLTSVFAQSQRTAQSRSLLGAAAVMFGLVKLAEARPWDPSHDLSESIIVLILISIGAVMLLASFWLRYGFPYSRVVLVPLLQAVVGAEESKLDDATVNSKVDAIMRRVRAQKPWWFYRPTWFY